MRVLHLWDNYAPSLFDHSFDLCVQQGAETFLACKNFIAERAPEDGRKSYVRLLGQSTRSGVLSRVANKARDIWDTWKFQRLVSQILADAPPDVIHIHYGTTAAILQSLTALFERPVIISFYGFDISQGLSDPAISGAYRQIMKSGPLIHVLCEEARERALSLGCNPDRIIVANLPLPVDRYPSIGISGSGISNWLLPARFVEKKGHGMALSAFREVARQYPESRMTFWGYGDAAALQKRVSECALEGRVTVIDNHLRPDFDNAYVEQLQAHDAIIAPSIKSSRGDDEGGPALTAVLAQAAAKPVILSDFPGSERSVTDGVEGLIVEQGNSRDLARAMLRLAAESDKARQMGAAGRDRVAREFSVDAYRINLFGWYSQLQR